MILGTTHGTDHIIMVLLGDGLGDHLGTTQAGITLITGDIAIITIGVVVTIQPTIAEAIV